MKKLINIKYYVAVYLLAICCLPGFTSCDDYLDIDKYIYEQTTLDSIWLSSTRVQQYVNGTVALLPNESRLFTADAGNIVFPFGLGADEAFSSWIDNRHAAMYLLTDQLTPQYTDRYNNYGTFYQGIRKCNIILQRIGECEEMGDIERRDYIGRAYFMRGYFYFSLLRQYGPVPILPDTPVNTDDSNDAMLYERSSYEACVEYICNDMENAALLLSSTRGQNYEYVPTSAAALAVISRIRLYAASPWYNGNTRYSSWVRSNGEHFIPQIEDKTKWGVAAAAAKRIIDLERYTLYTASPVTTTLELHPNVSSENFPNGAGNIDPYLSYKNIFDGTATPYQNDELIYYYELEKADKLSPTWIAFPYSLGGGNGFNVTYDFAHSYKMRDGKTYEESEYYKGDGKDWEPINTGYLFSGNYQVGDQVAYMHDNREPRFYASIGYNHCIWPGISYITEPAYTNYPVTYYKDGSGAPPTAHPDDYNRTGFTHRKYVHQEDNYKSPSQTKEKVYPVFRYAEILLNYVEAMNEMEGSYTDEENDITVSRNVQEMIYYFNMIRYRAGIPGITETEASDRDTMRELIKHERKIEFAFEGHRYHDLRRWGDANEAYNQKITGFNTDVNTNQREEFYKVQILDSENITKRTFTQKMYFYPIPQQAIDLNTKLEQNPGW